MKIKIDSLLLTAALKRATLTTSAAVNPMHKLVKLEARKGRKGELDSLVISSVAGVLALNTSVKAEVLEPGVIATSIREIGNAAGAMPLGAITMSLTRGSGDFMRVKLTGSSGRTWTAPTADPTNLQPVPEPVDIPWLRIPVEAAKVALETVSYPHANITEQEASWDGIRFVADGPKLQAVGCSRYQMAVLDREPVELGYRTGAKSWIGMVPGIALSQFRELLAEAEAEAEDKSKAFIDLFSDERFLYMIGPVTLVVAALPLGEYPPYEAVLEHAFAKEAHATLSRLPLIETIKACLAMRSAETRVHDSGAHIELRDNTVFVSQRTDYEFDDAVPTVTMQSGLNVKFKASLSLFLDQLKGADSDPEIVLASTGNMILLRTPNGYRSTISLQDVGLPQGTP